MRDNVKRIVIIAGLVVVAAIGVYFGYHWHQQSKLIEAITPHVKNTSIRTSNALSYEITEGSKITYKELFEKLEADISEIDKRLLEVQTISTPATKIKTDIVFAYLNGCQEMLRAQLWKYRKQLALSSASKWFDKSLGLYKVVGYYGFEYARKTVEEALKALNEAGREYEEAKSNLVVTAKKLTEIRTQIASIVSADNLVDPNALAKVVDVNNKKKDETTTAK